MSLDNNKMVKLNKVYFVSDGTANPAECLARQSVVVFFDVAVEKQKACLL